MTAVGVHDAASPRLSVVVPTAGGWGHLDDVLDSLAHAVTELGVEVVAVSGGNDECAPPARRGVTFLTVPQPDVFACRAWGVAHARGDVVSLLEDHLRVSPSWAGELIAAWAARPDADALVHSITTQPDAGQWETALFTITSGPFVSVAELPTDRLPVPGIVSFRRSLVGQCVPAVGWLEYDLLAQVQRSGRMTLVDVSPPMHVQPVTWRAPLLAFHSGRMFAGSRVVDATAPRSGELRRLLHDVGTIARQTVAARRRTNGGRLGLRFAGCVIVLVCAQVTGQLVGIVTRSPGSSAQHLD
ncbi:MAG: glycosyltransferase [Actinomycetota bacterium]|nr:glycosyltransferase [Actinomycetota bacterium]